MQGEERMLLGKEREEKQQSLLFTTLRAGAKSFSHNPLDSEEGFVLSYNIGLLQPMGLSMKLRCSPGFPLNPALAGRAELGSSGGKGRVS